MAVDSRTNSGITDWLPGVAAVLAFIACNGMLIVVAALALFGLTVTINPHLQAAAISLFAALTLVFNYLGYRRYRVPGPSILSFFGAVLIAGTMYIQFNKIHTK